jgi:hypothetical protein
MKLKATKALIYNTRRLLPGDVFECKPRDARVWLAIRKAEAMRDPVELAPPPPAVAQKIAAAVPPAPPLQPIAPAAPPLPATAPVAPAAPDHLGVLRAEYRNVFGKAPFMGWDAATLLEKIAAAKAG